MWQTFIPAISGGVGAVIGSTITWLLMTRTARNQARRDALVMAAQALQDYRVAYAQFYVQYLSPEAQASRGSWPQPLTEKPDRLYVDLENAVDMLRGRLRVVNGVLYAHFLRDDIKPLFTEIERVLNFSAHDHQADCREVDAVADKASDLIPDMIRRFR